MELYVIPLPPSPATNVILPYAMPSATHTHTRARTRTHTQFTTCSPPNQTIWSPPFLVHDRLFTESWVHMDVLMSRGWLPAGWNGFVRDWILYMVVFVYVPRRRHTH